MGLDHSLVGVPGEPQLRSWDSKDALLYAVGVGAGLGDPLQELEFTTENSEGIEQQVLPTFARAGGPGAAPRAASATSTGPCSCTPSRTSSCTARCRWRAPSRTTATVTGIYDKGSGALVVTENVAVDAATGEPLVTSAERHLHPRRGRLRRPARRRTSRRGSCRTGRPTTRSSRRPGRSRPCSTGCPVTATRCTWTRSSPPGAASASRSCTACAPTGSPAAPCCARSATATRPGSAPCPAGSAARCCPASR